jgi:hypothetical protein
VRRDSYCREQKLTAIDLAINLGRRCHSSEHDGAATQV